MGGGGTDHHISTLLAGFGVCFLAAGLCIFKASGEAVALSPVREEDTRLVFITGARVGIVDD